MTEVDYKPAAEFLDREAAATEVEAAPGGVNLFGALYDSLYDAMMSQVMALAGVPRDVYEGRPDGEPTGESPLRRSFSTAARLQALRAFNETLVRSHGIPFGSLN